MSAPAWTPGPWRILADPGEYNNCYWIGPRPYASIAEVRNGSEDPELGGPEAEIANARLIAAAPDLYEALKAAVDFIELCDEPSGIATLDVAHAALARARGEHA